MFITHGCQGQKLHDAGDELASWGVFSKYNWRLGPIPNNREVEKFKTFKEHEEYLYDWAKENNYLILIAGHTHIPAFMSTRATDESLALIPDLADIHGKEVNFSFINYKSSAVGTPNESKVKKIRRAISRVDKTIGDKNPPYYFNTGCGLFNKTIPCIEIMDGKISLKFIQDVDEKGLVLAPDIEKKEKNLKDLTHN
jgi:hypothetical protein